MTNRNNNQTVEFNSYEQAQGLALSVLATGLTLFGLFGGHPGGMGMAYVMLAFVMAISAYILGGGFGKALSANAEYNEAAKNLSYYAA